MLATAIGIVAAIVGVVAFVPQAWRVIKTRATRDLAAHMWMLNVAAYALWVAYGIELGKVEIVVPNVVNALLSAFILMMKLVSADTRERIASSVPGQ
jgi:MtN3 and saliva related transmembrane protein